LRDEAKVVDMDSSTNIGTSDWDGDGYGVTAHVSSDGTTPRALALRPGACTEEIDASRCILLPREHHGPGVCLRFWHL